MKNIYKISLVLFFFLLFIGKIYSQEDATYIYNNGNVIYKESVNSIDSIKFSDNMPRKINVYKSNVIVFEKLVSEIDSIIFAISNMLATLTTNPVSDITESTATMGGNITFVGFPEYFERGVCYSTSNNPTVNDTKFIIAGSGTGEFSANVSGLTPNTQYYVRAYAINDEGVAYGNEVDFTMECAPTSYYGDITFTTESQLLDFKNAGYEYVCGNVTFFGKSNTLHTLTLLDNQLKGIYGNLTFDADYLTTLDGLYGLETVTGNVTSRGPMQNFEGLNNLQSIGGNFSISSNYYSSASLNALTSLSGLENLNSAHNNISITNCHNLLNFCPLVPAVENMTGTWYVSGCGYNPTKYQMLNGACQP